MELFQQKNFFIGTFFLTTGDCKIKITSDEKVTILGIVKIELKEIYYREICRFCKNIRKYKLAEISNDAKESIKSKKMYRCSSICLLGIKFSIPVFDQVNQVLQKIRKFRKGLIYSIVMYMRPAEVSLNDLVPDRPSEENNIEKDQEPTSEFPLTVSTQSQTKEIDKQSSEKKDIDLQEFGFYWGN